MESAESASGSWAKVTKRMRNVKNLLVVKASGEDKKATEIKSEVSQALQGIQITDSRFTNGGNIVMNFDGEKVKDDAAQKLESVEQVCTKCRKI